MTQEREKVGREFQVLAFMGINISNSTALSEGVLEVGESHPRSLRAHAVLMSIN